jgi:hypothetical protein
MDDIEKSLELGRELRLVATTEALDSTKLWTLTADGLLDIQQHNDWVTNLRERAIDSLIDKAAAGLQIELDRATAYVWMDRIVRSLTLGIQASQSAYLGRVSAVLNGTIMPGHIDKDLVLQELAVDEFDEIGSFLRATALAAIDPLDPFGNELVSHITTGCVLHSYISGRDKASIMKEVGPPKQERAIIDTPVLLMLIGPDRVSGPAFTALQQAVLGNWDVIVAEHSLQELTDLVESSLPDLLEKFQEAAAKGMKSAWYASLVDEQLASLCFEAVETGKYRNFHQIVEASRSLAGKLESIGVVVRHHHNENTASLVERCRTSLERVLSDLHRYRRPQGIDRDAETMAMALRKRTRTTHSGWPGAWVVTSDRVMSPAYADVTREKIPLTLTLAQWTTLVTMTAEPPSVKALAQAAAGQLVEEAMWLIPARFPSDKAFALARQLTPEHGGSDTDLRVAQLTLDDAFDQQSATTMAAAVLQKRTVRVNALHARSSKSAQVEIAAAKKDKAISDALASKALAEKEASEELARQERTDHNASQVLLRWERKRLRRVVMSFVGVLFIAAGPVLGLLTGSSWLVILGVSTLAIFVVAAYKWVMKEDARFWPGVVALCLQAVGLLSDVTGLINNFTGTK